MAEQILTQKELIVELANYACTPDYDNIRFKEKIKQKLIQKKEIKKKKNMYIR